MRICFTPTVYAVIMILGGILVGPGQGLAAQSAPAPTVGQPPKILAEPATGTFLLTVFLRHDQSKTLAEINQHLETTGFYRKFPPEGIEVVSWYVMMGIGQVVTLRVPAERLREVNRALEESAWGGYATSFYPTYDYKAVGEAKHEEALGKAP